MKRFIEQMNGKYPIRGWTIWLSTLYIMLTLMVSIYTIIYMFSGFIINDVGDWIVYKFKRAHKILMNQFNG